jgi:hypothetical protein
LPLLALLPVACSAQVEEPETYAESQAELTPINAVANSATLAATATTSTTRYYIVDLGPSDMSPLRVNQNGVAIWNGSGHAHLYQNCASRDLGSLGGGQSSAASINSSNLVVGKSLAVDGRWRAFSSANGAAMQDLGGSTGSLVWEAAAATNFWGDVVGNESVQTLAGSGVRYSGGVATTMATFLVHPPSGAVVPQVVDMDDSEDVLGTVTDSSPTGGTFAVLSTNFGHQWTAITALPGHASNMVPQAMNRYAHVTGHADLRAFLSRSPATAPTDLGDLGGGASFGFGINNYDWVVGASAATSGILHAFLNDGTHLIDLNSDVWNLGAWTLTEATGVSDAGQIVGWGYLGGQAHAFYLYPSALGDNPCPTQAPPPSCSACYKSCYTSCMADGGTARLCIPECKMDCGC